MLKRLNWIDFKFDISNKIFTSELFKNKLNIFWREIMENKVQDNYHIWLLFRLQWANGQFVTIGKLVKLNKTDKDYLLDYILNNLDDKSDYYKETPLKLMIFSYTIKNGLAKEKPSFNKIDLRYQNYQHHKLPITINPLEYGKLIDKVENKYTVQISSTNLVIITKFDDFNEVKFFKEGNFIYEYKDHKINESTFIRSLNNKKFTFKDGELILLTIDKSATFISTLKQLKTLNNKIITFDIETYIKNDIMIPYLIKWYDGEIEHSYFLSDFKSSELMIIQSIRDLMIKKHDNFQIYIHNLSKFDGIFLLKILANLGKIKPIIHHGDLISIGFKLNSYNITFKDSLQMLIVSLRNLTKSFGTETQKSIFPYSFVNENNLDYIGEVPDFKYFNDISINEYNKYCEKFNNNWNLKNEAIDYCGKDVVSLYQVITKFNNMIFNLFNIVIHKYPTLSSLAFAIFRTHFLNNDEIAQLSGQIASDIRKSYTGGAVDMYIPRPPKGVKLYVYDVNSLYPFVMKEFDMPVGKPIQFFGDIRKIEPDAFGFFYCKIEAPDNLKHPILQTHVKTQSGIRTISPNGMWEDMLFSPELDNAKKYGYKIKILWGYTFEKGYIFKEYVDNLYNLRLNYPKSDPMNYIAKILLNSLYGRFGMDDNFSEVQIIHKDYIGDFENKFLDLIVSKTELDDYYLIENTSYEINDENELTHNINVSISSAITSYSRILMSNFKDNKVINLNYQHKSDNKTKIELLDSYLILPSSLRTLALKYEVNDQKGFFPYNFVNEKNLDYIGITPDISLFGDITEEEYQGLISDNWNLKRELIKYLELDLKALYQVIVKFSRDIFSVEKIDITKLSTNSAISFKIFRSNYLLNTKIQTPSSPPTYNISGINDELNNIPSWNEESDQKVNSFYEESDSGSDNITLVESDSDHITLEEFRTWNDMLDNWQDLDPNSRNRLNIELRRMLGEEQYLGFQEVTQQIEEEFVREFEAVLER
jgi:hypothetical protein